MKSGLGGGLKRRALVGAVGYLCAISAFSQDTFWRTIGSAYPPNTDPRNATQYIPPAFGRCGKLPIPLGFAGVVNSLSCEGAEFVTLDDVIAQKTKQISSLDTDVKQLKSELKEAKEELAIWRASTIDRVMARLDELPASIATNEKLTALLATQVAELLARDPRFAPRVGK